MSTRKQYSKEFKLDAVSLVTEQGYSRSVAARSLDIKPNILGRWVKESASDDGHAFRGNGKLTARARGNQNAQGPGEASANGERHFKKSNGILCSRNDVKCAFITRHKNIGSISLQCQVLGVSRSCYYHYQRHTANKPTDLERPLSW